MSHELVQWVITCGGRDFPAGKSHCVRKWVVTPDTLTPRDASFFDSLEHARESLPPGLYRQPRAEDDDPSIVEVWI